MGLDYLNKKVLKIGFTVEISIGFVKGLQLTKETVEEYEKRMELFIFTV